VPHAHQLPPHIVREARDKFNAFAHTRRMPLSFDELYRYFVSDTSYAAIARVSHVSHQAIQQTCAHLFGADAIRARATAKQQAETVARLHREQIVRLSRGPLARVADRAWTAGCEVAGVVRHQAGGRPRVIPRRLWLNDRLCAVHNATSRFRPNKRSLHCLARAYVPREAVHETDAIVIRVAVGDTPERFFVLPAGVLLKTHFRPNAPLSGSGKTLYLPIEEPETRNCPSRIDYLHHEDAWHLLS
jgi:hypothetical protein